MSNQVKYNVLPPYALVTKNNASVLRCINFFESGAENIYLVDDDGTYRWRAAQKRNTSIIVDDAHGACIVFSPLEPIVFNLPCTQDNLTELEIRGKVVFERNLDIKELLIVNSGGASIAVARTVRVETTSFNWQQFEKIPSELLGGKNKVYISSLANPDLANFFNYYQDQLEIVPLAQDNLFEVLSGRADGILLYEADVFPDCPKIKISQLYTKLLQKKKLMEMAKNCMLVQDYALISEKDVQNLSKQIALFDQSYQSIHVHGTNQEYLGTVTLADFRRHFPASFPEIKNIAVPYTECELENKRQWARSVLEENIIEIPFIQDGKIFAQGEKAISPIMESVGLGHRDILRRQTAYWQLISYEVALEFFGKRKRILISSEEGFLKGFRERFRGVFDISVYDGSNGQDYLVANVDVLLYESDIWPKSVVHKYNARQLYLDFLAEEMRRYWQRQGITYYACDVHEQVLNCKCKLNKILTHNNSQLA